MRFLVLLLLLLSHVSFAQTDTSSKTLREDSTGTVMVGYQLITSWLPSKKTISYTHIFNGDWSLEGEYSFASISAPYIGVDIGKVNERRYTLEARHYPGYSFNFSFGLVLSDFTATLGTDILDTFGQELSSSIGAQNLGVTGGIGNRWQWSNGLTAGIDWLRINIPLIETEVEDDVLNEISPDDSEDLKKIIRTFNRIPTFVLFGLNLGYTF